MAGYPGVAQLLDDDELARALAAMRIARKVFTADLRADLQPVHRVLLEIKARKNLKARRGKR